MTQPFLVQTELGFSRYGPVANSSAVYKDVCLWEPWLTLLCLFGEQQLRVGLACACAEHLAGSGGCTCLCGAAADSGGYAQLRRPFQGSNVAVRPGHRKPSPRMAVHAGPASATYKPAKPTLFDVPLSNHGARVSS